MICLMRDDFNKNNHPLMRYLVPGERVIVISGANIGSCGTVKEASLEYEAVRVEVDGLPARRALMWFTVHEVDLTDEL